jgi:hypothetical protein
MVEHRCNFNMGDNGICGALIEDKDALFCINHNELICVNCGLNAVEYLPIDSMLTEGIPLCDNCVNDSMYISIRRGEKK